MTTMARLEARLRSLSARERLLLLLCAAAVIAFAVVRWAVSPAVAEYRKAHASIPARRATLARYQAGRAGQADGTGGLAGLGEGLESAGGGRVPGGDPPPARGGAPAIGGRGGPPYKCCCPSARRRGLPALSAWGRGCGPP